MELDPSIILQTKPVQLQSPLELASGAMQLRNLGLQGQNAQITLEQNQRNLQDSKTIADLYRANTNPDGSVNHAAVVQGLANAGLGDKIPAYQQQVATARKDTVAADASQFDLHKKRVDMVSSVYGSLASNPNTMQDDVIKAFNDLSINSGGAIPPEQAAAAARDLPGPGQLHGYLVQKALMALDASKQLEAQIARAPKYNEQDRGAVINEGTVDPMTGVRTAGPTNVTKTMTPDQAAKVKLIQDRGTFTATSGDLLAALAAKGISLPAGMRSKEQQIATVNGLLRKYPDLTPDEIAENIGNGQINFGSDKKAATVAAGQEGKVSTAVNELATFGDQVLAASAKVPRGSFVPANALMQMADSSISDPNLLTLKLKLNALNNAYNVIGARGGTDAESRAHVAQLFAAATGPDGIAALVKGLKEEGEGAKDAANRASHVGSTTPASTSGAGRTVTGPPPVPVKSDADYAALKSGTRFLAPDGTIRVKP